MAHSGFALWRKEMGKRLMRHGIWFALALALGTLWGLIISSAVVQERRLLEINTHELTQLNNAVAQHSYALFNTIETDLRGLDLALHWQPGIDPVTDKNFIALVDEYRRASGGLIDVGAISSDGMLYLLPSVDRKPSADVADREVVIAALTPTMPPLTIGLPIVGRVNGRWGIPVSWRLSSPVGKIVALEVFVELDRLIALHDGFRMKPEGTIDILRLDGYMLSRTPFDAHLVGSSFKGNPHFEDEMARKTKGSFMSTGQATDGVSRIICYERLQGYPIVIVVTRGVSEVLADFYQRVFSISVVAAAISLVLIAISLAFRKSLRALHSAQINLRQLAATDELTKTLNRRDLFQRANEEFARSSRYNRPMAVLMLDLDHFKQLNDTHGHAAGDLVLQGCADLWQSLLRDQDLLGRIGGEEFCILLIETPPEAAARVAERLRATTAARRFAVANSSNSGNNSGNDSDGIGVTVSIGMTWLGAADQEWNETLARADRALYQAKRQQRNQVVVMEPEVPDRQDAETVVNTP